MDDTTKSKKAAFYEHRTFLFRTGQEFGPARGYVLGQGRATGLPDNTLVGQSTGCGLSCIGTGLSLGRPDATSFGQGLVRVPVRRDMAGRPASPVKNGPCPVKLPGPV